MVVHFGTLVSLYIILYLYVEILFYSETLWQLRAGYRRLRLVSEMCGEMWKFDAECCT